MSESTEADIVHQSEGSSGWCQVRMRHVRRKARCANANVENAERGRWNADVCEREARHKGLSRQESRELWCQRSILRVKYDRVPVQKGPGWR
jgi:hypothetical protein